MIYICTHIQTYRWAFGKGDWLLNLWFLNINYLNYPKFYNAFYWFINRKTLHTYKIKCSHFKMKYPWKMYQKKSTYLDLITHLNLMSNKKFGGQTACDFSMSAIAYDKGFIWPSSQEKATLPKSDSVHNQSVEGVQSMT